MQEGWDRVSKITNDRAKRIDSLPDHIAKFFNSSEVEVIDGEIAVKNANIFFCDEIDKGLQLRRFVPGFINLCGSTRNNLREFEFFKNVLRRNGITEQVVNVAELTVKPAFSPVEDLVDRAAIGDCFYNWTRDTGSVPALTLHSLIWFTKAFLSWVAANPDSLCRLVPLIVVSNDHSPISVAIVQAARFKSIPTVYLQHAEVTDHFPPLVFDINILHNQRSLNVYSEIGPIRGDSFILSRWIGSFRLERLRKKETQKVNVALYLTANFHLDKLNEIIDPLKLNPAIESIAVKPHPRTDPRILDQLQLIYGDLIQLNPIDIPDVAVVQNSSVVTELLHIGVKVFHIPGYDWLPGDYYGFVHDGICDAVSDSDLSGRFWEDFNYDEDWLRSYSTINPSATSSYDNDEKLLCEKVEHIIRTRRSNLESDNLEQRNLLGSWIDIAGREVKLKPRLRMELKLLVLAPITYLSHCRNLPSRNANSLLSLIEAVDFLHHARIPELVRIYNASLKIPAEGPFQALIKLKALEWTFEELNQDVYEEISSIIDREDEPQVVSRLEDSFLTAILRSTNSKWLMEFFAKARALSVDRLHISRRIHLKRLIDSSKQELEPISRLERSIYSSLSSLDRAKLDVLGNSRDIGSTQLHPTVLDVFISNAPNGVVWQFRNYVLPVYKKFESQMCYMDVRWSSKQRNKILDTISDKILAREAFSFIRLSEGEGYIYRDLSEHFTLDDVENRERHWWGANLDEETRAGLVARNRAAIQGADLLGIPSVYRFLRDISSNSCQLSATLTGRGLLAVLNGVGHDCSSEVLFTEEKANIPLFGDPETIRTLISRAEKTIVVSSIKETLIKGVLGEEVTVIPIPTHYRTHNNKKYVTSDRILPLLIDELSSAVRGLLGPGTLLLVSSGVAGKAILDVGKHCGAVAVDLGGAIDQWFKKDGLAY